MFEETLYQDAADGKPFVDVLKAQGILPGIKVDTGEHCCVLHEEFALNPTGRAGAICWASAWTGVSFTRPLHEVGSI